MPKTIAELTTVMDQFAKALDALAEGVALNASDEVAELLALHGQLVSECDERLQLCASLLAKGLRDEALGYESDEPPLLDTVTLLDLSARPQWPRWLKAMQSIGFPEPVMPKIEAAKELREAQEQVFALKPLLDQWRRANLSNASLTSRIKTLRRLRKADANNEAWFECLRAHEKQRLMEIDAEVKEAVAAKDEERLSLLANELQGDWIEAPPQRIRKAAESALNLLRGSRIDREIEEVATALVASQDARDLDAARGLYDRWNRLLADKGAFAADDIQIVRATPAIEWLQSHDRLESLFAEVWSSLDARPATGKSRRDWVRSLTRMRDEVEDLAEKLRDEIDLEPIERLRTRVARVEEDHMREQSSRRRLTYLAVAAVATAVIGSAATAVSIVRHNDRVTTSVAEINALIDRASRGEFEPEKVPIPELPTWLLNDPAVAARMKLLETTVTSERDRLQRLTETQTRVSEILDALAKGSRLSRLEAWPESFVVASKLLSELTSGAIVKTATDQVLVEKQTGLLQNAARRFERDGDEVLKGRISELNTRLSAVREQAQGKPEDAADGIAKIDEDAKALRLLATEPAAPGAAGSFANSLKVSRTALRPLDIDGELFQAIATVKKYLDEQTRLRSAEQRLDEALGDWPRYAEALESIASEFPESAIARDYREAAKDSPAWQAISKWNEFAGSLAPYSSLSVEQAKKAAESLTRLKDSCGNLSVVQGFLKRTEPLVQAFAQRNLDEVRKDLTEWVDREWLGELAWCIEVKSADGSVLVYYSVTEPPKSGSFTFQPGMKVAGNWPPAQRAESDVFTAKTSPQKLLADDLEKACVDKIPDAAAGVALDEILVDAFRRTIAAENVEPCLRLLTVRKIVLVGRGVSPAFQSPDMEALHKELDDGNGGIPGVEIADLGGFLDPNRQRKQGYLKVRKVAERALDQASRRFESLKKAISDMRKALSHKDVQTLACVGRISRDTGGATTLVPKLNAEMPTESDLLMIGPNGEAVPIGKIGKEGRAAIEKRALVTGIPVFVWQTRGAK